MTTSLKDKLKTYFNITDTSKDDILELIIDNTGDIIVYYGIDSSLQFSMCVEDYSYYLKSGNTAFQTSQASDGVSRYSPELMLLLKSSASIKAY